MKNMMLLAVAVVGILVAAPVQLLFDTMRRSQKAPAPSPERPLGLSVPAALRRQPA